MPLEAGIRLRSSAAMRIGSATSISRTYGSPHISSFHSVTAIFDFPAIMTAITEAAYDGWLMVELDDYDGDPRIAAEFSKTYLDELSYVRPPNQGERP
nr:hypothetical protein [Fodinicola feengrottensis]